MKECAGRCPKTPLEPHTQLKTRAKKEVHGKSHENQEVAEKSLVFEGCSRPLFGIFRELPHSCNVRQGYVRCCKIKDLRHLFFFLLPNRSG